MKVIYLSDTVSVVDNYRNRIISLSAAVALTITFPATGNLTSLAEEKLITKTFEVPINFLELAGKRPEVEIFDFNDVSPFGPETQSHHPRGILGHHGITFGKGCFGKFDPEEGLLEVKNTAEQMELIEHLVAKFPKRSFAEEKLLVSSIIAGPEVPTEVRKNSNIEAVKQKLQTIRIPKLQIESTTFPDALQTLQSMSVEFDSDNSPPSVKGVSMIIDGTPARLDIQISSKPEDERDLLSAKIVSINKRDISLASAFQNLAEQAGYKYKVESYAVVFTPALAPEEKLITTKYFMPMEFYEKLLALPVNARPDPFADPSDIDLDQKKITPQMAMESCGITFPSGSHIRYYETTEELFITNTANQIELAHSLISSLDAGKIIMRYDSRYHRD